MTVCIPDNSPNDGSYNGRFAYDDDDDSDDGLGSTAGLG